MKRSMPHVRTCPRLLRLCLNILGKIPTFDGAIMQTSVCSRPCSESAGAVLPGSPFSQLQLIAAGTKHLSGQPCRVLSTCGTSGDDGFRGGWTGWLSLAGAGIPIAVSNLLCSVQCANDEEQCSS